VGDSGASWPDVRPRTVEEDWRASLPSEPGRVYGTAHDLLKDSYVIQSVTLNQAFVLCAEKQYETARQCTLTFAQLFDRLAEVLLGAIQVMEEHGRHFGTLPNVHPLDPVNFRGPAAQQVARLDNLLGRNLFKARSRFFHKLSALEDALTEIRQQSCSIAGDVMGGEERSLETTCSSLEVLDYDLNTCMQETLVVLKSFFCALPAKEVAVFREKLLKRMRSLSGLRR